MSNLFLFFGFFFPRATLLVCFVTGSMPANDTPFIADLLAAIVAPRLLIAWWLYATGAHPLLVVLFALGGLAELGGGSSGAAKRRRDRDT